MTASGINILRIDSSARHEGSQTRQLTDSFLKSLEQKTRVNTVVVRDVSKGVEFVDQEWVTANVTDEKERNIAQKRRLENSDMLIAEIAAADVIVIGAPIYNFGLPAALKAWVDQIARGRKTFRYTEDGPVGLLKNKRAVIISASGGTELGGKIDFATPYLKHILGFIGIQDVELIKADRMMVDAKSAIANAEAEIEAFIVDQAA